METWWQHFAKKKRERERMERGQDNLEDSLEGTHGGGWSAAFIKPPLCAEE